MSDQRGPEPSKGARGQRARSLALPRWFTSREAAPAAKPGADRPLGESLPVVVALPRCALGACLTVLAIGRITAASRQPAAPRRAAAIDEATHAPGARS